MEHLRIFLLFLLGGLLTTTSFAQVRTGTIKGNIVDEVKNEPISFATIRVFNSQDSTLVKAAISGNEGSFLVNGVELGDYYLVVSNLGYAEHKESFSLTSNNLMLNFDKIKLAESSIMLDEAIVVGKAPEVIVRNDTIEYNADSYKIPEGSALEDLLKKMPGVEVDADGKVTVNGKEIKKFMVDGKEFFSSDPKVASKNLPAKMFDKVQVLDKKSDMSTYTGFDDDDEETIINLTVRPGMKEGVFGNAFVGYGSEKRYEGNAMVNQFVNNDQFSFLGGLNNTNNMGFSDLASSMFSGMSGGGRRGFGGMMGAGSGVLKSGNGGLNFSKEFSNKLTIGGSAQYSHSDRDAQGTSYIQNLQKDTTIYTNEESMSLSKSDNVRVDLRLEWKPDTLTSILFRPNMNFSKTESSELSRSSMSNMYNDTINEGVGENFSKGDGLDLSGNLLVSRRLNNLGRVLSLELRGGYNDSYSKENAYSLYDYYDKGTSELVDQYVRYDNKGHNYRASLSWVEPLGRNNFLQLIYEFNRSKQESLKNAYNQDESGIYNQLDTTYSKNYRNDFINQSVKLNFRAKRDKYEYTLGVNLDPSYSKSENFIGDEVLSSYRKTVFNISPSARFDYQWSKQKNLRFSYSGRTSQPSMQQLSPVADVSDQLNVRIGNPDLKPIYTNNVFLRFQNFISEKQQSLVLMLHGNYVVNDIVSKSDFDISTGKRTTTYENVNGNYGGNMRLMFNTPLKNKKFTVSSMSMASFSNNKGFVNMNENVKKEWTLSENLRLNFRSEYLDLGVNGSITYRGLSNSLEGQRNQETFDYRVGGSTTIYLPANFRIESDINYSTNTGYSSGFEQKELLWNASASYSFLKGNAATLRFKMYDILKERSNISRTTSATEIRDVYYNTIPSYFMVHFIYKFSLFKGGGTASDMQGGRMGEGRGHGGHPPRSF